jgi:hypothetical protein
VSLRSVGWRACVCVASLGDAVHHCLPELRIQTLGRAVGSKASMANAEPRDLLRNPYQSCTVVALTQSAEERRGMQANSSTERRRLPQRLVSGRQSIARVSSQSRPFGGFAHSSGASRSRPLLEPLVGTYCAQRAAWESPHSARGAASAAQQIHATDSQQMSMAGGGLTLSSNTVSAFAASNSLTTVAWPFLHP